ncbi:hypothetical protein CC77DRAFT_938609 [Alternaria alternata]|uniref:F-box domain-containing protein n=1 Tax=Alternaria alternata TaxID=5599 RepID=A0A177DJ60_ALTAL|nr:hypothetical protein CC77DRAFT_938609 [Alternaria alternata]XP_051593723.1 uncharacterized protein J4E82_000219 [Alternaria postmessia]KAH6846433.1 hypothetical protein B0T12DRAFT_358681 [Alternaria alternata]KAI5381020.1 hypothetical protein J4E82_000219 [Alternaria postmessia]OAG19241.1 hypothetical protein CC77DRAFT_938609 [Alternaria alternata]
MSAPSSPESRTPTGVGPPPSRAVRRHAVSMSPDVLPVEIWHIIIMYLDDRCFAWFVLRQTCPFLAHVTEDVFARYVSRTCSLRFAGQTLRTLLPPDLRGDTQPPTPQYQAANVQLPSFRFQPSSFVPANTKARLVLKLSSPATARDTPSLHQTYAGTADLTSRLTQVFFQPGAVADAERTRLLNQAHFVLFNDQLKSIRLPSAAVHVAAQELSLDWRQLCHTFMRDEFKCRFGSSASVAWWRKFP